MPRIYCEFSGCGQFFLSEASLTAHGREHEGKHPWVCSHPGCGAVFVHKHSLTYHATSHDMVQDTYQMCPEGCDRYFRTSRLKVHLKIIHGIAPTQTDFVWIPVHPVQSRKRVQKAKDALVHRPPTPVESPPMKSHSPEAPRPVARLPPCTSHFACYLPPLVGLNYPIDQPVLWPWW